MRAFVIGTGPSLADVNLDRLSGELTITTGRIHVAYDEMLFRPTAHVIAERDQNPHFAGDIRFHLELDQYPVYVNTGLLSFVDYPKPWTSYPNVRPVPKCRDRHPETIPTSWHPPHICTFGGALPIAVQLAIFHYQADEIFLLGCDGNYQANFYGNHFHSKYQIRHDTFKADDRNETLMIAHNLIAKECAGAGVRVCNLSPRSAFDMYEAGTLDDILPDE
jgi:hypothetical protein